MNKRRKFIQLSSAIGVGALLPLQFCSPKKENSNIQLPSFSAGKGTLSEIGVQLISVRSAMAKDPQGTIKKLAQFGYNYIESFDGGKGIYWGMGNKDFKSFLDDLGLNIYSSLVKKLDELEQHAKDAADIGIKYLICPWAGPQKNMDGYKTLADDFNNMGEICKQNGVKFAYHNHGYSFMNLDGEIPQDYLMDNTDPDLVDFELDFYWAYSAGQDPVKYLEKYPNRFVLGHIKDKDGNVDRFEPNGSTLIGEGVIDFRKMLRTGMDNGMQYFLVEQERFVGNTPTEAAEKNAAYMRNLVF